MIKFLLYSTAFFLFFEVINDFYIILVRHGMVIFYLFWENLLYLDKRLQVNLKLQPMGVFFGLILSTPYIKFSRRMGFAMIGFIVFYLFDVIFAVSQILDFNTLLSIENFIRFISVFIIWIIFSYKDYLKKKKFF